MQCLLADHCTGVRIAQERCRKYNEMIGNQRQRCRWIYWKMIIVSLTVRVICSVQWCERWTKWRRAKTRRKSSTNTTEQSTVDCNKINPAKWQLAVKLNKSSINCLPQIIELRRMNGIAVWIEYHQANGNNDNEFVEWTTMTTMSNNWVLP